MAGYSFTQIDQILRSKATSAVSQEPASANAVELERLSSTYGTLAGYVEATQSEPLALDRATFVRTLASVGNGIAPTSLAEAKNYSASGIYLSLLEAIA